jgi:hypothetical protein
MANSKYEYVKQFELNNVLLPSTFIVVRIDGKGFHKFTEHYQFTKPNDKNVIILKKIIIGFRINERCSESSCNKFPRYLVCIWVE